VPGPYFSASPARNPPPAPVVSKPVSRIVDLPRGDLPFLTVSLARQVPRLRPTAFWSDPASVVKQGDLLVTLSGAELKNPDRPKPNPKCSAAESDRRQAEAQLAAVQSTYELSRRPPKRPEPVAGNELFWPEKQVDAAQDWCAPRQAAGRRAVRGRRPQGTGSVPDITAPFRMAW